MERKMRNVLELHNVTRPWFGFKQPPSARLRRHILFQFLLQEIEGGDSERKLYAALLVRALVQEESSLGNIYDSQLSALGLADLIPQDEEEEEWDEEEE
jgi:hypothetical protein